MKNILVTGGSGFIGSNLVKFLIKKNFFVINVDNNSYTSYAYNLKKINKKKYKFFKLDINNKKGFLKILKKYKPIGIFNLAAETHVDRSIDNPTKFIKSNILGVFNLLECLKDYRKKISKNIKLIHISTDEVYGDMIGKNNSNENSPYNPSSPYSASKASADHLIKSYIRTYKFNAVISNCCNNYGPGQYPEKLIPTLIFNIINNKPLTIYGKGKNSREWIHVNDHCNALLKLFKSGKSGNSYNVGSGININNINLSKKLLQIVKNTKFPLGKNVKIKFVKDRPGHDLKYSLNSQKIKKEIKWKADIKLNNGLLQTFEWYFKNPNFFKVFSKKNFYKRLGTKI